MSTTINASSLGLTESVDTSGVFLIKTGNLDSLSFTSTIANCSSTTALIVPSGTTAQRPASPVNGMIRYNTTSNSLEGYLLGGWTTVKQGTYTITYLAVAGGAGSSGVRGSPAAKIRRRQFRAT